MKCVEKVRKLPFFNDLKAKGAKVYVVGGAVRDHFLKLESKDLDILVSNIELDDLTNLLSKYGKVDLVGKSFGVIKFKAPGEEIIDIALPRTDKSIPGGTHKSFEISVDPFMKIEDDLKRRDFTINAIAIEVDNDKETIIDPYNGIDDIKSKLISSVHESSFSEDPLRIMRAVQFAARFDFKMSLKTIEEIEKHKTKLLKVSKERIVEELQKMITKGVGKQGLIIMVDLNLHNSVFGETYNSTYITMNAVLACPEIADLAQFLYIVNGRYGYYASKVAQDLKCDKETIKRIGVINNLSAWSQSGLRIKIFENYRHYPEMLVDPFFHFNTGYGAVLSDAIKDFQNGVYPKTLKEVNITSLDLMNMKYQDAEIGDAYKSIVKNIMRDKLENKREKIIEFLTNK